MLKRYQYKNKQAVTKMTAEQVLARDRLQEKIERENFLNDPLIQCWCGCSQFHDFAERERFGMKIRVVMCDECGSIAISPRFSEDTLKQFYKDHYRLLYAPDFSKDPKLLFQNQIKLGTKIVGFLPKELAAIKGKILDVGCACGGALIPFKELGWDVYGCDYDENQINYGKKQGLNLVGGGLDAIELRSSQFDVILLNDVLEHQRDPQSFLLRLKKILKPNGVIYIQMPGIRDLENNDYPDFLRDLQLAHLFYWDLTQLDFLFCLAGFEMIKGNEVIKALFRISPKQSNLTIEEKKITISRHRDSIVRFLEKAEKNRFCLFLKNNRQLVIVNPKAFLGKIVFFVTHSI